MPFVSSMKQNGGIEASDLADEPIIRTEKAPAPER
jgi:hypothetical protein